MATIEATRNFLEAALAVGLECEIIQPSDVMRHITPDVFSSALPAEEKTKLLTASLNAGRMDADVVFDTLDPRVFAEHMPHHMLWACLAEAAQRVLSGREVMTSAPPPQPEPASATESKSRRRPNISRRPARLKQSRKTKAGSDYDPDAESSGVIRRPRDSDTDDKSFNDWIEETATGDSITRRRR